MHPAIRFLNAENRADEIHGSLWLKCNNWCINQSCSVQTIWRDYFQEVSFCQTALPSHYQNFSKRLKHYDMLLTDSTVGRWNMLPRNMFILHRHRQVNSLRQSEKCTYCQLQRLHSKDRSSSREAEIEHHYQ